MKKKCTAFLLSDLMDVDQQGKARYEDALKVAVNRHDLSVINVYDPREKEIPDVGLVNLKDSESGETLWVNTSSKKTRQAYKAWMDASADYARSLFMRYSIDNVSIATNQDYVKGLMTFFQKR
jgi:hypothetical protein